MTDEEFKRLKRGDRVVLAYDQGKDYRGKTVTILRDGLGVFDRGQRCAGGDLVGWTSEANDREFGLKDRRYWHLDAETIKGHEDPKAHDPAPGFLMGAPAQGGRSSYLSGYFDEMFAKAMQDWKAIKSWKAMPRPEEGKRPNTPIKSIYMSLKQTLRRITRKEPQKSFIEIGVTDEDGNLTPDGRNDFVQYLFDTKLGQEDFYETVVKPVAEEEAGKDRK